MRGCNKASASLGKVRESIGEVDEKDESEDRTTRREHSTTRRLLVEEGARLVLLRIFILLVRKIN